jgi:hypothetical protein
MMETLSIIRNLIVKLYGIMNSDEKGAIRQPRKKVVRCKHRVNSDSHQYIKEELNALRWK